MNLDSLMVQIKIEVKNLAPQRLSVKYTYGK